MKKYIDVDEIRERITELYSQAIEIYVTLNFENLETWEKMSELVLHINILKKELEK